MLAKLLLLFTIVPIVELAILIPLGEAIGIGPTVALVLGTGILGAVLAKRQGLAAWRRLHEDLGSGRLPGDSLLDGLAVLIAGMVLLVPPLRKPLKGYLERRFKRSLESGSVNYIQFDSSSFSGNPFGDRFGGQGASHDDGEVIDVTPEETQSNKTGPNETRPNETRPGENERHQRIN